MVSSPGLVSILFLFATPAASLAQASDPFDFRWTPTIESASQGETRKAAPQKENGMSPKARHLISDERSPDSTILWDGFLNGLRGFEHFYDPIGQPLYFETPFNDSSLRPLFLHHAFHKDSLLGGGELNIVAAQARLALTERLSFIATKDGHSWFSPDIFPDEQRGWNDLAIGMKYVAVADREADFVLTPGIRWMWEQGTRKILQGNQQELSPFISFAKGFDEFHLIGNVTYRLPERPSVGNQILQYDLHTDVEVCPGVAPVVEFHGLTYLTDGEQLPFNAGGLDYTNLGSMHVAGETVVWTGVGARFDLTPSISLGSTFEFPLTKADDDIMGHRITVDLTLRW